LGFGRINVAIRARHEAFQGVVTHDPKAHEDARVADVVVLEVISLGVLGDQEVAVRDVHPDDQRAGFRRRVRRDAHEHLLPDLQGRLAVRRRELDAGQGTPDRLHTSKADAAWHWSMMPPAELS
jgi:hypothetical protein